MRTRQPERGSAPWCTPDTFTTFGDCWNTVRCPTCGAEPGRACTGPAPFCLARGPIAEVTHALNLDPSILPDLKPNTEPESIKGITCHLTPSKMYVYRADAVGGSLFLRVDRESSEAVRCETALGTLYQPITVRLTVEAPRDREVGYRSLRRMATALPADLAGMALTIVATTESIKDAVAEISATLSRRLITVPVGDAEKVQMAMTAAAHLFGGMAPLPVDGRGCATLGGATESYPGAWPQEACEQAAAGDLTELWPYLSR